MRVDKVFVQSSAGLDALATVNCAKDFFTLLFSNWMRWGNKGLPYQRGTRVRSYVRTVVPPTGIALILLES
ncbi:hypothetical protein TSUD_28230 [Trifolium subterraneum]|uniref:Uncharacterized protein n=1 Tax=Trifolium subterraneum TaxID=3900 RepID=A0A2Z6PLZ0_TRISU|nr:hypothetical protein TSUD_28230 [Trifolium subterraneum]